MKQNQAMAGKKDMMPLAPLYLLFGALLVGTLWRGGYFPVPKWYFALLLLAAGAAELFVSVRLKDLRIPATPLFWMLAALAALGAASAAWSISPRDSFREAVLLLGLLAAAYTVYSELARDRARTLDLAASGLIYAGGFTAAWGIITYILRMAPYSGYVDGFLRAGSTFEYSNALSCFGLMALPVTAAAFVRSEARDRPLLALAISLDTAAVLTSFARFGYVALFLMCVYFVVIAGKRGATAALLLALAAGMAVALASAWSEEAGAPAIGLAAVLLLLAGAWKGQTFLAGASIKRAERQLRRAAVFAAAGVLLAAPVVILLVARLRQIVAARFGAGMELSHLLPHRFDTYHGAVDALRVHPLAGFGLGSFPLAFQSYAIASYTRFAHNLVLQTAVDIGLIGGAIMALFLVYAAVLCLWRLARSADALQRAFALSALVFIAYNMFDWEWYVPALAGWFIAALFLAAPRMPEITIPENGGRNL